MIPWYAFVLACEAVGITSGLWGGAGNSAWYQALTKPSWQPPSWLFGPVWTILYALMGIAVYLVYKAPASNVRTAALTLFAIQLALNFLWTPLFFRYHVLGIAALEIVALLVVLAVTTALFFMVDRRAAYLLVPYLAWVTFATTLSITVYRLN